MCVGRRGALFGIKREGVRDVRVEAERLMVLTRGALQDRQLARVPGTMDRYPGSAKRGTKSRTTRVT